MAQRRSAARCPAALSDQLGTLTAVTKGGEVVERFDAWKEEVGTALFARERGLSNPKEQKLEQGLEESMAGSDPVSVTQPAMPIAEKPADNAEPGEDL